MSMSNNWTEIEERIAELRSISPIDAQKPTAFGVYGIGLAADFFGYPFFVFIKLVAFCGVSVCPFAWQRLTRKACGVHNMGLPESDVRSPEETESASRRSSTRSYACVR
jgi:hypothetical protein